MARQTAGGLPSIAALVRTWRERALLTQAQLARRTGLGVRTIRRLESGTLHRPRSESVRLLADALELTDAERALLAVTTHPDREPSQPGPVPVPRQLPADVTGFIGRTRQLRELDAMLAGDTDLPTAVVISAIAGAAGVGKTALAVHWAHRVAHRFPDGQLYVNLRGFGPTATPTDPATALRGLLQALDVPHQHIPPDLDAQAALYRSLLAGRRLLVILDNARDPEQVRPLLPGAPGCLTLVTSRNQLTGLVATENARPLTVDLLSADDARVLLATRLGAERTAAEPTEVDEIIARCARLPLALAVVAARIAARSGVRLSALAAELREAQERLDPFATGDAASDLRAVFSWSYLRLGHDAARLYRLLASHPGPDIATAAAASLCGTSAPHVTGLLTELTEANLIMEYTPGRFVCHDLLRAFAIELARTQDSEEERGEARIRLLDHYLHTAHAAALLLHPLRKRFDVAPARPGVAPEALADKERALGWLTAEHTVLVAAVHEATDTGHDRHAYQLAWCLTDYLDWHGHWHDWEATQDVALRAARRLGDPAAQVLVHRGVAGASFRQGDYARCHTHLLHALELLDGHGDATERAQVHLNLSTVLGRQARHDEALIQGLRSLELYRAAGDRVGEGDALGAVGWSYSQLGVHRPAVGYCQRSLALHRALGNPEGEAATLDSLGHAHHHLGEYAAATACFERAIELCRTLNNRYYEAFSLMHLGDTHRSAGDHDAARARWRRAVQILDELGHPDAHQLRAKLATVGRRRPEGDDGDGHRQG